MTVDLLDHGEPCPGPQGGRWHHQVRIDGHTWRKGDTFYVTDRHGAPREMRFVYHYTGTDSTVCYGTSRYVCIVAGERRHIPAGYVTMTPVAAKQTMSTIELRARQLRSDLLEAGLADQAAYLTEALEGDQEDMAIAVREMGAVLQARDEAEDVAP